MTSTIVTNNKMVQLKSYDDKTGQEIGNIFPITTCESVKVNDNKTLKDELLEMKNFRIVQTVEERDALTNVKNGEICFVELDNVYYSRVQDEWDVFNSGSGNGGAIIGTLTSTLDQKTLSIAIDEPLEIDVFFSTPNVGAGTLYVLSDGAELVKQSVPMGNSKITVNLKKGTHKLEVYVIDRGGVYTNKLLITVNCGGLDITTTFDSKIDYNVGSTITFPYTIDTISNEPITTYFKIGKDMYQITSKKGGYNTYTFPSLGAGTYNVEIYAKSGEFESRRIAFTLVILNSDSLYVSSLFDKTEAEEGDQLIIDYRVSMKNVKEFNVIYYIDDIEYKRGKALNGANTFPISTLEQGDRKITIKVSTLDGQYESVIDINITIVESSYQMIEPVESGLIAWFDAYGLTNQDLDKERWKTKNESELVGTLHNFNYTTNGWLNNGLKMNGSAYVELNVQPFLNNADTGLTIDVEFETEDIGNENARVLDCTSTTSLEQGCYVDTREARIKSNSNTVKSSFAQKEKTRVTYVIDRTNKILKLYINAVLSEVAFLKDSGEGNDKLFENFQHGEHIYLNSQKGIANFGDCTVYSVRIYSRPLDSEEVLQNHIADIKDKVVQKQKYDFNHNNTIPTMYFEGDVTAMTKANPVELRIRYISTNDTKYGQSFDLPKCKVNWQGTSSLQYEVKNYKIKLRDENDQKVKRALREGMIEESTFVLKADYMESSHANNTGLAKIVNNHLYAEPLPPQKTNEKVVSAIDGFPIKLYINKELIGVFNFNLDKGNEDSFGFDSENPNCISYEISANTDTTAGAFNKWNGIPTTECPDELTYLKKDFELRFPDDKEKKDYGYLDQLKRVVDWVSDADETKFKAEFDQYFNREYTFKYYLFVLTFAMVDNLGKNMMLNTWDGKIWYPCFYDLDTGLSLDNSGYVKFDVDVEVESGKFNTSSSKLWSKIAKVFDNELKEMYIKMRSTIFKEDKICDVLIGEQIDQIPELLYNLDSEKKYIQFGTKYIHMLHGSRREHMRKWINERLLYLDSKMGYEENIKESITVRANKKGWVNFKIKTYSPMYIKVKWRNGDGGEMTKKIARNQTVDFGYDLPTATDQEIIIYGAKHLKEIGDLTNMTPSSLSLGNASKLTKLECRNNSNLQALGMDGNLKNLQVIDLTGCANLGTASGNNDLNVSKCDNLKTLKVSGTSLQSITFNHKGGNLEEIYLPTSMTSLHLANQYNLTKVTFPWINGLHHRIVNSDGSRLSDLTIINCPKLTSFGTGQNVNNFLNYKGGKIGEQSDDFDIPKQDYQRGIDAGCFGHLESVTIDNSLLQWNYYMINYSPSLRSINFKNMTNLKGVIFFGNRTYGPTGGSVNDNKEGTPAFDNINISQCDNFDTIIFQNGWDWGYRAYKFKENFEWDLSHLRLKRFICNISLQNLKKLILPDTIKEFYHSKTVLVGWDEVASDKSKCKYTADMSPLETIIIKGQHDDNFKGIDLGNIKLKNVSFNGLTKKVDIIQNVNCEAIDVQPKMSSEHVSEQPLDNIHINFDKYTKGFYGLFQNTDMLNINITRNNVFNGSPDYSYMFNGTKNIRWENIKSFIEKLPPGKVFKTFENCHADELKVGHMFGPQTTSLERCFYNMKATKLDVSGATAEITNLRQAFSGSSMRTIIGLNDFSVSRLSAEHYYGVFSGCGVERLDISSWNVIGYEGIAYGCYNIVYLKMKFQGDTWTLLHNANANITDFIIANDTPTEVNMAIYTFNCYHEGTADCNISLTNVILTDVHEQCGLKQRKLTVDSMLSIINALKDYNGQNSKQLRLGSKNLAKLSAFPSYIEKARAKNWTITE